MLTPNDVFTPGKLPIKSTNIYAARGEAEIEFGKIVRRGLIPVIYGEYGVGKTTMARYLFLDKDKNGLLVNIESAAGKTIKDIFSRCLEKMGFSVQTKTTESSTSSKTSEASAQAEINSGWGKALIANKKSSTEGSTQQREEQFVVTSPTDSRIIEECERHGLVLLIDELHKASTDFVSDLSKLIKTYGNANCSQFKIVLLGTSSNAGELVKYDPGIDRLLQEVHLKSMTHPESEYIVTTGMRSLGIKIDSLTTDKLVKVSVGSPSILQYLSLEVAELAFERDERKAITLDIDSALSNYVKTKAARLYSAYAAAIETVGEIRYRKQILRAMAEVDDEYVTMEIIRERIITYVNKDIPSTALSGPLRDLKEDKYGPVLRDVQRPDGLSRITNYTAFVDPALKSFIRMQVMREISANRVAGSF